MRRRLLTAAAITAGLLSTVLTSQAASAAVGPTVGGDVSRWQGSNELPALGDFAIVAVNTGVPIETNPHLLEQLAWASAAPGTGHPPVEVYVASADPGLASKNWWPSSDRTLAGKTVHSPYGRCSAKLANDACSWVYGNSIARDDVGRVPAAARVGRWWIDIEGGPDGNTWSSTTARNRAVVEGMIAGLTAARKQVGLYSATSHFREVLGEVPGRSPIADLPFWAAGAGSQADAARRCAAASLTSGRLTLVQWRGQEPHVDYDLACAVLTKAPKPKISGSFRVGRTVTAKPGTWGPGAVHLAYRWTRDGRDIAKATHETYVLKKADKRHRIAVTVTATETGYSRSVKKSASHRIAS